MVYACILYMYTYTCKTVKLKPGAMQLHLKILIILEILVNSYGDDCGEHGPETQVQRSPPTCYDKTCVPTRLN